MKEDDIVRVLSETNFWGREIDTGISIPAYAEKIKTNNQKWPLVKLQTACEIKTGKKDFIVMSNGNLGNNFWHIGFFYETNFK